MSPGGHCALALALLVVATPAPAGEADVVDARVACDARRVCTVWATIRHADEGWDHYADGFEVVAPDGAVLGRRVLRHPHVDEQPFTRALESVTIPADVRHVTLRAHDSRHGDGGKTHDASVPPQPAP